MATNAGRGGFSSYSYASKDKQWEAFNRLPRSVRDALNEAVRPWAPYPIWRWWNRGDYIDAKALVKEIKRWDREALVKASKAGAKALIVPLVVATGIAAASLPSSTPAMGQQCEVRCFTNCSPHGRCCRRCVRYCSAPRYYAPPAAPDYSPHYEYTPAYQYAAPQLDPATILIAVVAGLVAIVGAIIAAVNGLSAEGAIAAIEQSTQSMRAQVAADDDMINAIRNHKAAAERDAFEQGRRDADEEWRSLTHE